jgi:hypothetical protein
MLVLGLSLVNTTFFGIGGKIDKGRRIGWFAFWFICVADVYKTVEIL